MRTEVDVLRVLVLSHAAVLPINQEPFAALAGTGAEVTVVAPRSLRTDIRGTVTFEQLPPLAGHVVRLPVALGGFRRAFGGQRGIHLIVYRGLERIVEAERPDVMFVEEEPFSLAAAQAIRIARARRIPVVVHENQNIARRLPPPFEQIRRWVLARAAGVTVRNGAAVGLVRSFGFSGPVGAFPHAVDAARYEGAANDSGLPAPVVGFVGRLVREKGILDLVTALAGTGASLLVAGDGPLANEARDLADMFGVPARWLGAIAHEDVPAWYGAMDVVAVPSRSTATWMEQFGRIVIEAGAAAAPVVATDSGELPATIEATGGGVTVREGDIAALRTAIVELLGDEARRRTLGDAGRRGVEKRFTHDAVAAELARFLAEVAG